MRSKQGHEYTIRGGAIVLKACGGDRRANLEGIADEIQRLLPAYRPGDHPETISAAAAHTLRGFAEQLRIIADEWPR